MQEINGIALYSANETAKRTNRTPSALRGLAGRHNLGIKIGERQRVFTQADIDFIIEKVSKLGGRPAKQPLTEAQKVRNREKYRRSKEKRAKKGKVSID